MNLTKTLLAAATLAFAGSAASAAGVHIEDFGTGAPGGVPDPYQNDIYEWTPVTPDNGAHCYGGLCLHEAGTQELLTTTDTYNPDADVLFDLLGFFVDLTGNGAVDTEGNENFLQVTGYYDKEDYLNPDEDSMFVSMILNIDDLNFADFFNQDGEVSGEYALIYDRNGDPATEIIPHGGSANGVFVMIQEDFFDGITFLTWEALGSANVRIDCVALSTATGLYDVSVSDMTACDPVPNIIPVPAGLPLLASALGIVGVLSRRKKFDRAA